MFRNGGYDNLALKGRGIAKMPLTDLGYIAEVPAPSTPRVQAHRQRKRQGVRSVRVELTSDQLARLVDRHQYLDKSKVSDAKALQQAVQSLLSDALIGEILV
jgi:hypothetical protein